MTDEASIYDYSYALFFNIGLLLILMVPHTIN